MNTSSRRTLVNECTTKQEALSPLRPFLPVQAYRSTQTWPAGLGSHTDTPAAFFDARDPDPGPVPAEIHGTQSETGARDMIPGPR